MQEAARAAQIEEEAAAAAIEAKRQAALAEIDAALENGTSFSDALAVLSSAPDGLVVVADKGVPTLSALRADFPELARGALGVAHNVTEGAGTGAWLTAFIRRQTNARSLSAREGDGVDAILSRAEANLRDGALSDAMGEIASLPAGPRAVFDDWVAQAQSRVDALSAFAALTVAVN